MDSLPAERQGKPLSIKAVSILYLPQRKQRIKLAHFLLNQVMILSIYLLLKKNQKPKAYNHYHVWIDNVVNHKATALFLWMNCMGAILLSLLLFYSNEIFFF